MQWCFDRTMIKTKMFHSYYNSREQYLLDIVDTCTLTFFKNEISVAFVSA